MMGIKRKHSKEKYTCESGLIIQLEQPPSHIYNLNTRQRVIKMIQVISSQIELTQPIGLFLVGNVKNLMHQDSDYSYYKAPPFPRDYYDVGDN